MRRRRQIVGAARELLREYPADKIVVADIAERAGVSVATVYNLVGTRDHVLMAVLDQTATQVIDEVDGLRLEAGVDGCLAVLATACDVILADAVVHRHLLAELAHLTPGLWLDEGLTGAIALAVDGAAGIGELDARVDVAPLTTTISLGFRGALMSWVFGQLDDAELDAACRRIVLVALLAAASPDAASRLRGLLQDS